MTSPHILSVQVGRIAPLGPDAVPSGFVKRPVATPLQVGPLGLDGDEQADLSVHGGPDKAVYAYPHARYADWLADYPEHGHHLAPGAFGENLTISGLTEADLCAGDIHEIGTARLQVCQPRQPCFKFALHFQDNRLPKAMVRTGRSGWYYRVLQEGRIAPDDTVRLIERPHPNLPFERLVAIVYHGQATKEELSLLAQADGVARRLRAMAVRSLAADTSSPTQ